MEALPQQIPLLNCTALHNLKDGTPIRFRGMIQDMHNPEFYFETYEIIDKNTGASRLSSAKYKDTADIGESESINYNSPHLKSAERNTMTVITIPGQNVWARDLENNINNNPTASSPPSTSKTLNLKRSLDTSETNDSMETEDVKNIKKDQINNVEAVNLHASVSRDHILNFPLPDDDGKVCLVKVYDQFDNFKLNDVIEVTGYLSVDPALSEHWNNSNERNASEMEPDVETLTHNPPPSLVPRIHALKIEKLQHCNPLIDDNFNKETVLREANEAREHLRIALTQILFGDSLAADYLICHLISHVYIRKDVMTLGKFTLNLWNIPSQNQPSYTEQLYSIIKNIVVQSHYLPLTIENLNTMAFTPKKDYDCNRLTSGILQLSKNTHLLLDETKMLPGKLDNTGVLNLATLGNVIQHQKVKYDFKFYQMDFDCDIPVLIVSEGRSLLPNEVSLPLVIDDSSLKITNEIFEAANHYLNPTLLDNIRKYLTNMKLIEYTIEDEPDYIQEDFVEMRKNINDGKETTAEDLHRLLVLTRLVCLSRGYDKLTKECWDIAKNMEQQRCNRLK